MPKIIPLDRIDDGIKSCLQNAQKIIKSCDTVFNAKIHFGEYAVVENAPEISTVLYYYALEEIGKAIKLEDSRVVAKQNSTIIDISSWYKNHDEKIQAFMNRYGEEWHIFEADPIPKSPSLDELTFHPVEFTNPSIRNFNERSNLLLTDYDEGTRNWGRLLEMGTSHNIEIKISKIQVLIKRIQIEFNTSGQIPITASFDSF